MTQYPPKIFFLQGIFQAIEVVLQNTRIQTRGPNAGGDIFTILHSGHSNPSIFSFFILFINQPNVCPSFKCCVKKGHYNEKYGNIKSEHRFFGFFMQLKYLYFSTSFVFPCNKVSLECRVEKLYHRL